MSALLLIFAIGLVFLNGLFVAAEFSMVKLRHTRVLAMQKTFGIRGKLLAHVHKQLDTYLSACQVGITFSSLGLGWVGEPAFADLLEPLFHSVGINSSSALHATAFFVAFFIISFLHIVLGELAPKSLAIRSTERISLMTVIPLYVFNKLVYPIIWILNYSANFLLKLFHLDSNNHGEVGYSARLCRHFQETRQDVQVALGDENWRQVMPPAAQDVPRPPMMARQGAIMKCTR